ncbi:MAG: SpoIIE family protein phosphatase [Crocinitomicaceae bacterium]|nr:SpoIIE family protein phosphatase [Crocinitomicaceae bacterium]
MCRLIVYYFVFIVCVSYGQREGVLFKHINSGELKGGTFFSHQWDSRGSLWAASEKGLVHFNGYSSRVFKGVAEHPALFKESNILSISKTGENVFWISYINDHILSRFDPLKFEFQHFHADTNNASSIPTSYIVKIFKDSRDIYWLCTWGKGLYQLDPKTGECTKIQLPAEKNGATFPMCVSDIIELNDGRMLISFFYESGFRDSWPIIYNVEENTFQKMNIDKYSSHIKDVFVRSRVELSSRIVNFSYQDEYDHIWFGSYSGLIRLDVKDSTLDRVVADKTELHRQNVVNTRKFVRHKDELWITTPNEGLMVANINTQNVKYYKTDIDSDRSISDNRLITISKNSLGEIWIMTRSGNINIYQEELQEFHLRPWGLFDLSHVDRSDQPIPASHVQIIDNTVYISHGDGVRTYNLNSETKDELFFPKAYLSPVRLDCYSRDFKFCGDHLAIIVHESPHVYHLDSRTADIWPDKFLSFKVLFKHSTENEPIVFVESIPTFSTFHIYDTIQRDLEVLMGFDIGVTSEFGEVLPNGKWLLSEYFGRFVVADPQEKTYELYSPSSAANHFPDSTVRCSFSKDKDLWLGTASGIYSFDPNSGYYEKLNLKLGLTESESVNTIYVDDEGTFWLGLKNELYCYNRVKGIQMRYGSNYGLSIGEFLPSKVMKDDAGKLYFQTVNGLLSFNPEKVLNLDQELEIFLSDVWVNDSICDFTRLGKIENGGYEFGWEENYLTFEFSTNHLFNLIPHQFKYRLIGQGTQWIDNGKSNKIRLPGLGYGKYKLEVFAKSAYGNNSNILSIPFTIEKPYYRTIWFYLLITFAFLSILFAYIKRRERVLKNRSLRLEKAVKERTLEVVEQKKEADYQRELVELKQKEITDSIAYAKRIQMAILPDDDYFYDQLPDSFILYKPKDIVAGDFYWMKEKGDHLFFAVADCTGHGVPGAMVSVVCSNALNRTLREEGLTEPGKFLDHTREIVIEQLSKEKQEEEDYFSALSVIRDGMDISFCMLNKTTNELQWAGANNPLWIFRGDEFVFYKGDKQPIGNHPKKRPFLSHKVQLQKGDMIYLFTDGYADQFGHETGRKFKIQNMKTELERIKSFPVEEQKALLHNTFEKWRGTSDQIDDVCVIGVRI